jgi:2,5-diketo-D-gluconate reductase A
MPGSRLSPGGGGHGAGMSSTTNPVPNVALLDGVQIPQLGFGVFQVPPEDTADVVGEALEVGLRHVDTAAAYENEAGVGEAVRASGLQREELFITTKCPNGDHGYDRATRALHGSLERLGLDAVDLYLIHWPVPSKDLYVETWRAFVDLREQGLARAIGVSNFQPGHLERIVDATGVTPAVNQVELHPRLQQPNLRSEHADRGIATEAYSPLARGEVLDDPVITGLAQAHDRTPGQIVLRWHLQLGNVVIPKSSTPERIRENFELFDFELGPQDMDAIAGLDAGERIGGDPDTFG